MNSFNTDAETSKVIKKYMKRRVPILTFNQSKFPRIWKDDLLPVPASFSSQGTHWFVCFFKQCRYPPGHGDIFCALKSSGVLEQLISKGKEYIFISNIDNLGATIDYNVLNFLSQNKYEFLMEVTEKTKADIKGGTLVEYNGNVRLLEVAQVPAQHLKDFMSIKKFRVFNTNNVWMSLSVLNSIDFNDLDLEIIANVKLETAMGSAIKNFKNAVGVTVPRSRFLPIKGCSDLFLLQSDLYSNVRGTMKLNAKRQISSTPLVIRAPLTLAAVG
ncbi:UTP-glucose-1-phosphate uridylyltransferase [Mitosporidium daphniae]|uniref:UTP--glucose-1-phosphate uridylyltransferase n=1 Tax=Mitosporidium daphniae TaxID=1485682 RepID=A0A098VVY2_9MICR|nr:UTP-glucose-1-phosphate uridylyltransferase [Mitosporidium daphniae]KGG53085.1 UTP-glucose-1-phosphate uridylyltransferase [Mitosporidium daphniae]|eukprot:XP_013239512.1 UTP-glucose-1-phosphate uridylyltransferase [Mitosporidium daphniae]